MFCNDKGSCSDPANSSVLWKEWEESVISCTAGILIGSVVFATICWYCVSDHRQAQRKKHPQKTQHISSTDRNLGRCWKTNDDVIKTLRKRTVADRRRRSKSTNRCQTVDRMSLLTRFSSDTWRPSGPANRRRNADCPSSTCLECWSKSRARHSKGIPLAQLSSRFGNENHPSASFRRRLVQNKRSPADGCEDDRPTSGTESYSKCSGPRRPTSSSTYPRPERSQSFQTSTMLKASARATTQTGFSRDHHNRSVTRRDQCNSNRLFEDSMAAAKRRHRRPVQKVDELCEAAMRRFISTGHPPRMPSTCRVMAEDRYHPYNKRST